MTQEEKRAGGLKNEIKIIVNTRQALKKKKTRVTQR